MTMGHDGRRDRERSLESVWTNRAVFLLLAGSFAATAAPFLWLLMTSLKSSREIFEGPFRLPSDPSWQNYQRAWTQARFADDFANSVLVTVGVVLATLLLSSMAAYAIARFPFKAATAVHFLFLAGMMIPIQLAVVPLFFQMKALGLLGSLWGLGLVYLATSLPFAVFLLVGFFKSLPGSLREAALIDGASEWKVFWQVMLPLARPGMATVAVMTFLGVWNEYLVAFLLLSGSGAANSRTLPLGLANMTMVAQFRSDFGLVFAGIVMVMMPTLLVYVALERQLTRGLTAGASKG